MTHSLVGGRDHSLRALSRKQPSHLSLSLSPPRTGAPFRLFLGSPHVRGDQGPDCCFQRAKTISGSLSALPRHGTARGLAGRTEQGRVAEREEGWEKVSREEGRVSVGTMCEQVVGA